MLRIDKERDEPFAKRVLYPLLAKWSSARLSDVDMAELRYFFGGDKGHIWRMRHTIQRIRNRVGRVFG